MRACREIDNRTYNCLRRELNDVGRTLHNLADELDTLERRSLNSPLNSSSLRTPSVILQSPTSPYSPSPILIPQSPIQPTPQPTTPQTFPYHGPTTPNYREPIYTIPNPFPSTLPPTSYPPVYRPIR
jgi:hypothetical protein